MIALCLILWFACVYRTFRGVEKYHALEFPNLVFSNGDAIFVGTVCSLGWPVWAVILWAERLPEKKTWLSKPFRKRKS